MPSIRLEFFRPAGIDDAKMVIAPEAVVNIDHDSGVHPWQLCRLQARRHPWCVAVRLGLIVFHSGRARAVARSKRSGCRSNRGASPSAMQQIPDAFNAKVW